MVYFLTDSSSSSSVTNFIKCAAQVWTTCNSVMIKDTIVIEGTKYGFESGRAELERRALCRLQ